MKKPTPQSCLRINGRTFFYECVEQAIAYLLLEGIIQRIGPNFGQAWVDLIKNTCWTVLVAYVMALFWIAHHYGYVSLKRSPFVAGVLIASVCLGVSATLHSWLTKEVWLGQPGRAIIIGYGAVELILLGWLFYAYRHDHRRWAESRQTDPELQTFAAYVAKIETTTENHSVSN